MENEAKAHAFKSDFQHVLTLPHNQLHGPSHAVQDVSKGFHTIRQSKIKVTEEIRSDPWLVLSLGDSLEQVGQTFGGTPLKGTSREAKDCKNINRSNIY